MVAFKDMSVVLTIVFYAIMWAVEVWNKKEEEEKRVVFQSLKNHENSSYPFNTVLLASGKIWEAFTPVSLFWDGFWHALY